MTEPRWIAGAMSGTSADGVDAAVLELTGPIEGRRPHRLAGFASVAFAGPLRSGIQSLRSAGGGTFAEMTAIGRQIVGAYGDAVAAACRVAGIGPRDLAAVAAHGQTLYHAPPETIQWFDPSLLASRLGCVVVSDFRRADLAAGGQGAPLVPFADHQLFRSETIDRVVLNVGGIANVTILPAGADLDDVRAFDTGPGNCVLDHLCRTLDPAGPGFDDRGRGAARGRVEPAVVAAAMADEYFRRDPPKTTDGPAMIAIFDRARVGHDLPPDDLLATATAWTAASIAAAARGRVASASEWIVAGGGADNPTLMTHLAAAIGTTALRRSDVLGVPSAAREAIAFALLGLATLEGRPSNVPAATGARGRVILGSITPAPGPA